jgi:carboxypeptidase Q
MIIHYFKYFLWLFILVPVFLQAQDTVDTLMMQRIRRLEADSSEVAYLAHRLTDVIGPRLTNSPGHRQAVNWTVSELKTWGLTAAPEAWGEFGKGWRTEKVYVAMEAPYIEPMIAYPRAWTAGTGGPVTADVLVLDKLDSASIEAMGQRITGKIILIRTGRTSLRLTETPEKFRYENQDLDSLKDDYMITPDGMTQYIRSVNQENDAIAYLKQKGVVAILTKYYNARDGTVFVAGSRGFVKNSPEPLPQVVITTEDYLKFQRLLDEGERVVLQMDIRNQWYEDDLTGYNVIGEIPGTDPQLQAQVVMLGAHLDSWHSGTGATDNGAGCIVMMEAVRLLKILGVQPRRTIRIALWGGEEQGLKGSFGYVKKHFGDPLDMQLKPEQKDVSVYFNLDNGTGKIRGIYVQDDKAAKPIFESWFQPFADLGATYVTLSNTGQSDHLSFDAVGIPAFGFIQDPLDYATRTHHTNMDVYDHLALDDLKQAAVIVAGFVYDAAMRNSLMPRKPLPKPGRFIFDMF